VMRGESAKVPSHAETFPSHSGSADQSDHHSQAGAAKISHSARKRPILVLPGQVWVRENSGEQGEEEKLRRCGCFVLTRKERSFRYNWLSFAAPAPPITSPPAHAKAKPSPPPSLPRHPGEAVQDAKPGCSVQFSARLRSHDSSRSRVSEKLGGRVLPSFSKTSRSCAGSLTEETSVAVQGTWLFECHRKV
jgi:hypothetical protein